MSEQNGQQGRSSRDELVAMLERLRSSITLQGGSEQEASNAVSLAVLTDMAVSLRDLRRVALVLLQRQLATDQTRDRTAPPEAPARPESREVKPSVLPLRREGDQ